MNKKRKETIDLLWIDTLFGKWVLAASKGLVNEAEELEEKIAKQYPFMLDYAEKELCKVIANELKSPDEFKSYLEMLDEENPQVVEFMISRDIFGKLY